MARQRGNRWQADVILGDRRVRKSFETKEAAEQFERLSSLGLNDDLSLRAYSQDNFVAIWGGNRHPETQRKELRALYRVLGENIKITDIDTPKVARAITKWRKEGLAPATINHRLSVLSKLLKHALDHEIIDRLPKMPRQRVSNLLERVWSKEDEQQAFEFLDHLGLTKTRMVLQFLLYTGARKGEAYKLKRKMVKDGRITFDRATTKSGKTRVIPLVPKAKEAWDYLCKASDLECPLQVVNEWTLREHWERIRDHFGAVDDRAFVPHMLRHTCATRLVLAGIALPKVMLWMGHQSIQVTMRYSHVAPSDLDVAAAALAA